MRVTGFVVVLVVSSCLAGCRCTSPSPAGAPPGQAQGEPQPAPAPAVPAAAAQAAARTPQTLPPGQEMTLFDGKTLGQWRSTDFGGQGEVAVKDGAIHMAMGSYMTGINWTGPVVRMNYEITLEAMRVDGTDFFCGLTFPVGDKPCSLILGGWGGSVCGLSSLDSFDASENETTRIVSFETGKWYRVRLRVVPDRIQAWLDDEPLVDVDTTGRNIDIRLEVEPSRPLGIATWNTAGAVRNIRLKKLADDTQ
jgi:hypothetical protein